jgi:hypothetical protein
MRFFWTGNLKNPKPISFALSFFILFLILFWIGNFVNFWFKFGFSIEMIGNFLFGEPDFPLKISPAQVLEEAHINLFVIGILFLCLSALLIYSQLKDRTKIYLIASIGVSGIIYIFIDLLILSLGREFSWLKIFAFSLFQSVILVTLIIIITFPKLDNRNGKKFIAYIVFIFAILNLIFVVINLFVYSEKIGLSISQTSDYYLGNHQKFIKQKSIQGAISISQLHFLPMAIYILTLAHFIYLVNEKFNLSLTFLLFSMSLIDNISGILILYFGKLFSVVKFISFLSLEFLLFVSSLLIILKLIISKFNFPNRGRI